MSADHHHPSRRGEPLQVTPRVRHRASGRKGRLAGQGTNGDILVLFDGDTAPRSVPLHRLQYLDELAGASTGRG